MSDPTKGWKVQVDPDLPDEPKFLRLAALIKSDVHKLDRLEELVAAGLLLRLWCLTMKREDTGTLHGWAPEEIATRCGWIGDVKQDRFIEAMLNCGKTSTRKDGPGFLTQTGPDYEVYRWNEWQNNPAGTRQKWRDYRTQRREAKKGLNPEKPGAAGDSSGVKLLLDRMRECHITGTPQQKREHAEAWLATGRAQRAETLIMGEGKGKGIFWLAKVMDGNGAQHNQSTKEILEKWAKDGDAKDAAAKGERK